MDVFYHFASKIIDPSFVAYGKRIPHGTNFACATLDLWLCDWLGRSNKKRALRLFFCYSHSIVADGFGDIS